MQLWLDSNFLNQQKLHGLKRVILKCWRREKEKATRFTSRNGCMPEKRKRGVTEGSCDAPVFSESTHARHLLNPKSVCICMYFINSFK